MSPEEVTVTFGSGHGQIETRSVRVTNYLIKNEKPSKVGVKTKRLKAGWSDDYLLKIIGGI